MVKDFKTPVYLSRMIGRRKRSTTKKQNAKYVIEGKKGKEWKIMGYHKTKALAETDLKNYRSISKSRGLKSTWRMRRK